MRLLSSDDVITGADMSGVEKKSTAAPFKVNGYTCTCGGYTDITNGVEFECVGCGRKLMVTCSGGRSRSGS